MRTPISVLALVLAGSLLAACGEGRTRGPDARVIAIHAASSYGQILFLREERLANALEFSNGDESFFETGQYDFNLEIVPPLQAAPRRLKSFSVTLEQGTEYYVVITEVGGLIEPLIVTQAPFNPSATTSEVSIVHAAPASPAMDIYLTAPGAVLSAANPSGTATFNQHVAPTSFAPGDYQLAFTEVGNPLNVLFTSPTITLFAGQSNFFVIADTGDDTNGIRAVRYANGTQVLPDLNAPSSLRMINAATDALPRDVFVDSDFSAPFLAAVPYAVPTTRAPIAVGDRRISVTPAGNPGVIEVDATTTAFPGNSHTGLIAGAPGALLLTGFVENRRRIIGEAHLRYYNGAAQFSSIEISIVPVGGFPFDFPLSLPIGASTDEVPLPPGDYELTVYIAGSATVGLGPLPITVASEGLYSILFLNGPTVDTVSVVLFDDFP